MDLPGVTGDWTPKETIAHLAAWRQWAAVTQLESALRHETPVPPWGDAFDEHRLADVELIDQQFYEAARIA